MINGIMYGVKLKIYSGQVMEAWVWGDKNKYQTSDKTAAEAKRDEYKANNPKGIYEVCEIDE